MSINLKNQRLRHRKQCLSQTRILEWKFTFASKITICIEKIQWTFLKDVFWLAECFGGASVSKKKYLLLPFLHKYLRKKRNKDFNEVVAFYRCFIMLFKMEHFMPSKIDIISCKLRSLLVNFAFFTYAFSWYTELKNEYWCYCETPNM